MIYGVQVEWLTEWVAKLLDNSYSDYRTLLEIVNKKSIPPIYELEYEFESHDYDSYIYAYLMVSYLIETLGKIQFLKLIGNSQALKKLSSDLVKESIDYYNKKYID